MKNEGEGRRKGGWTGEEKVSYSCLIVIGFCKHKGSSATGCGSAGVGVVVLEEVCLVGAGFEGSYDAQPMPSETDHFRLPARCWDLSFFSSTACAHILPCPTMVTTD